jgi:hypothetical protein
VSDLKTKPTGKSVKRFLDAVENERRREDAKKVLALMKDVTGEQPRMWGESIVGFGKYRYRYDSGREGEWFLTGFSPRKQSLTLYIMSGFSRYDELLKRLGKHKTGSSCLYVNRLEDVDEKVLRRLVKDSVAFLRKRPKA